MAIFRSALILFYIFIATEASAAPCHEGVRHHIIQQICNGKDAEAVLLYRKHCLKQDYPLLREMGFAILERDARSCEPSVQKLALFGIALTADEHAIAFFHEALQSGSPELQLYALQQLCRYHDAGAEIALRRAMNSPYPLMRLEAAFLLSQGRYNCALSQIESLMQKCPDELLFIFPEMLVQVGSEGALQILRKLLMNPCQLVRMAAIHAVADRSLDAYAPYIRTLASQHDVAQLEACAYALAELNDHQAVPLLLKMTGVCAQETKLAAYLALYRLGYSSCQSKIVEAALSGNPYAIHILPLLDNQEEVLYNIYQRGDTTVRANAAIALLSTKDRRAPALMVEYLSPSIPQPPLMRTFSPGKSLYYFRTAPLKVYDTPLWDTASELGLLQREEWLEECFACGEEPFLELADRLIAKRQNDLMPALFQLLGQSYSDGSEKFLERCARIPGYPLARNYALAMLMNRGEKESCEKPLWEWISQQWKNDISDFRPALTHMDTFDNDCFQTDLKPKETAKLFLDAMNVIIKEQNEESIAFVLEGLEQSHCSLHPIFAALLIRLTQ